jgi:hypothetical protein
MTAAEHARRAVALRAAYIAFEGPLYCSAAALFAFAVLAVFRESAIGATIVFAALVLGLSLIRAGLRRRADHHELAAEYLDAAPPRRSSRGTV